MKLLRRIILYFYGISLFMMQVIHAIPIFDTLTQVISNYYRSIQEQKSHQRYIKCLQDWNKLKKTYRKKLTKEQISEQEQKKRAQAILKLVTDFRALLFKKYASENDKKNAAQHASSLSALLETHYKDLLNSQELIQLHAIGKECFFFLHGTYPSEEKYLHAFKTNKKIIAQSNDSILKQQAIQGIEKIISSHPQFTQKLDPASLEWIMKHNSLSVSIRKSCAEELRTRLENETIPYDKDLHLETYIAAGSLRRSGVYSGISHLLQ